MSRNHSRMSEVARTVAFRDDSGGSQTVRRTSDLEHWRQARRSPPVFRTRRSRQVKWTGRESQMWRLESQRLWRGAGRDRLAPLCAYSLMRLPCDGAGVMLYRHVERQRSEKRRETTGGVQYGCRGHRSSSKAPQHSNGRSRGQVWDKTTSRNRRVKPDKMALLFH